MTTTIAGIDNAPTSVAAIRDWVTSGADLTTPDTVVWGDASEEEWHRLTTHLVDKGTFVGLTRKAHSFWCVAAPDDVALVEDRYEEAGARVRLQQRFRLAPPSDPKRGSGCD